MNGYRLNNEDTAGMVRWLMVNHPENANEAFAEAMLIDLKLKYRKEGWVDPDKLEDHYLEYLQKLLDQKGSTSED